MLFFLHAVSVVLILTGGGAALFGAETIRTESGAALAMVGAGVTCAGLLLLAVAQVLRELRKLRVIAEDLVRRPAEVPGRLSLPPLPDLPLPPLRPGPREESEEAADKKMPGQAHVEPDLHARPEPPVLAGGPGRPAETEEARKAPVAEEEAAPAAPERASAVPEPPGPGAGAPEAAAVQEEEAREAAVSAEEEPPAPAKDANPIATYNSGGNTYFMYADGTIEADTPRGRYRFSDMAELRVYAETGEGGVRIGDTQRSEPPTSS